MDVIGMTHERIVYDPASLSWRPMSMDTTETVEKTVVSKEMIESQKLRDRAIRIKNLDTRNMYNELLTYLNTCLKLYGLDYLIKIRDTLKTVGHVCSDLNNMISYKKDEII